VYDGRRAFAFPEATGHARLQGPHRVGLRRSRSRSGRQCRDRRQAARDDARDLRGRRRLSRRPRARPVREGSPADDRRVRLPAKSLPARAQEVLGLTQSAARARLDSAGAASGRPWAAEQRECALAAWVALASLKQ